MTSMPGPAQPEQRPPAARRPDESFTGRVPRAVDRGLSAGGFTLAGLTFIAICFIGGTALLFAGGIDVLRPAQQAATTRGIAAVSLLVGFAAAVGGIVAWVITWRRGLPAARWAALDVVLQAGALAIAFWAVSMSG